MDAFHLHTHGFTCRRRHWAQGERPADPKLPMVPWWRRTPCWRNFLSCPGYGLTHTNTQTHTVKSSESQQHEHTLSLWGEGGVVISKLHTCKLGAFNDQEISGEPLAGSARPCSASGTWWWAAGLIPASPGSSQRTRDVCVSTTRDMWHQSWTSAASAVSGSVNAGAFWNLYPWWLSGSRWRPPPSSPEKPARCTRPCVACRSGWERPSGGPEQS